MFAPRGSAPPRKAGKKLDPIVHNPTSRKKLAPAPKLGDQTRSILSGIRTGHAGMPGNSQVPRLGIAPRRQLPFGGSTLTNRIQVLVDQVRRPATARAAAQELCLLASSTEACRLAVLAAGGDMWLLRALRDGSEDAVLVRWCLTGLNTLASDYWARARAVSSMGKLAALLEVEETAVKTAAVQLLTNLSKHGEAAEALQRLGAASKLVEAAEAHGEPGIIMQLRLSGLFREKTPPLPALSLAEIEAAARDEEDAAEVERLALRAERQVRRARADAHLEPPGAST